MELTGDKYRQLKKYVQVLTEFTLSREYKRLSAVEQTGVLMDLKQATQIITEHETEQVRENRRKYYKPNKTPKNGSKVIKAKPATKLKSNNNSIFMSREREKTALRVEIRELKHQRNLTLLPPVKDPGFLEAYKKRNYYTDKINIAKRKLDNLLKGKPLLGEGGEKQSNYNG